ncbi:MAG TPA: RNA 2',3'-cyclic phosphodiesterase, partial [Bacillota bacterium]
TLRCFVAVPVNGGVREQIAAWRNQIRKLLPNAKWVHPDHYHLTLKFYGELAQSTVEKLAEALRAALSAYGTFEIELGGLGAFPDLQRPRVLWVGVRRGAEHLRELAGIVEAASVGLELPAERDDYHPHLTLARFRVPIQAKDLAPDLLLANELSWGPFTVETAHLISSRLTPRGPIYTNLYAFPLGGIASQVPIDGTP